MLTEALKIIVGLEVVMFLALLPCAVWGYRKTAREIKAWVDSRQAEYDRLAANRTPDYSAVKFG